MSDGPSGEGPRGGDGTRSTVEDLRGRIEPSSPPGEIERAETVAAVLSFVVSGSGHVRTGLQTRGLYWLGAWLLSVFITSALAPFGTDLLLLVALPLLNLVIAVDAYRQVRWWRGRGWGRRPVAGLALLRGSTVRSQRSASSPRSSLTRPRPSRWPRRRGSPTRSRSRRS